MTVTVMLELQVQPDKVDGLIGAMKNDILPVTRKYDGCEGVEVQQNQDDKANVILIERWASRQHYEKYLQFRTDDGTIETMGSMVAAPPSIRYYDDTGA